MVNQKKPIYYLFLKNQIEKKDFVQYIENQEWKFDDNSEDVNLKISFQKGNRDLQQIINNMKKKFQSNYFGDEEADSVSRRNLIPIKIVQIVEKINTTKNENIRFNSLRKQKNLDINQMKELYKIYGKRLIQIKFGSIELFNFKVIQIQKYFIKLKDSLLPQNGFSMDILQQQLSPQLSGDLGFDFKKYLFRWGKVFLIDAIKQEKDDVVHSVGFLNFYFLLCRERLYTLRQILKIGDAMELQDYPFRLAYIGDLEDTIDFSLDFLNSDKFKEKSAIAQKLGDDYIINLENKELHLSKLFSKNITSEKLNHITQKSQITILPFQYFEIKDLSQNQIDLKFVLLSIENQSKKEISINIYFYGSDEDKKLQKEYQQFFKSQLIQFLEQWQELGNFKLNQFKIYNQSSPRKRVAEMTKLIEDIIFKIKPPLQENILEQIKELPTYLQDVEINGPLNPDLLFINQQYIDTIKQII